MHPVLFSFSWLGREIVIGTYGVVVLIGIAAGTAIATGSAFRLGFNRREFFSTAVIVVCGGIIGAFLAGFLIFLPERIEYGFWSYPPVLISWGGMAGGFVTLLILGRAWSINILKTADAAAPAALIGFGIGRIGCHFAGCCYGVTTGSSVGVVFSDPLSPASLMAQPLLPTQLISAAVLLALGGLFFIILGRFKKGGTLFFSSLAAYGIFRFIIEFWRADPRVFIFSLSDGQVFSVIIICIGTVGIIRNIN